MSTVPLKWRRSYLLGSLLLALSTASAHAICTSPATPAALQSFEGNPAAWLASNGKASDLGAQVVALAAAAVNSKDPGFGKALNALLGSASADQGTAIGAALATLNNSCSDPRDPNDIADKQYISLNIAPNMRANGNANTAYGEASGPQTASVGGGAGGGAGGGGAGVGGQTGGTGLAFGGAASGGLINLPNGGTVTLPSRLASGGVTGASYVSPHR